MSRRTALWCVFAVAVASYFARIGYDHTAHGYTDWVFFEVGARVLVHYHHQGIYGGDRWHLYLDNVDLQIGPPAFWAVAAFEWLPVRVIYSLFTVIMTVLGLTAISCAAQAGRWSQLVTAAASKVRGRWREAAFGSAAILTAAIWAYQAAAWKHLDDVLALTLAIVAAMLIARQRAWWLVGLLLGTAAATKPWAIILAPMLLGLPRGKVPQCVLVTVIAAAAWWAPFVISAPSTIQALGHFNVFSTPGSVLYLVGIHGQVQHWLRPLQFTAGIAAGYIAATRRGWTTAPLVALATRVLTDPYPYGYYGLGPLLFAFFYDCAGAGFRNLPTFTLFTAALEFGTPHLGLGAEWIGAGKLIWGITILVLLLRPRHEQRLTTSATRLDAGQPAAA